MNAVLICQQSWWCPFFRITSTFEAQRCFIQCRCWLSGSQLAWVSHHVRHWECNDEVGSIPALKKLTVWKGALTKNTHSHINVRGKKSQQQRWHQSSTEGSGMLQKSAEKHMFVKKTEVWGTGRQRKLCMKKCGSQLGNANSLMKLEINPNLSFLHIQL